MKNRLQKVLLLWVVGLLVLFGGMVWELDCCRRVINIPVGQNQWIEIVNASRHRIFDRSESAFGFYSNARKVAEVQLLQCH